MDKLRQAAIRVLEAIGDCSPNKALVNAAYALREALDPELQFIRDWNEGKVRRVSDGKVMGVAEQATQNIGDGVMLTAMQHPHNCCVLVDDVSEDSIEQVEQAEQEPVAWHHPQCEGQCIACLIEKAVQDAYGTQGRDYMLRHINAAPVRTKDQK